MWQSRFLILFSLSMTCGFAVASPFGYDEGRLDGYLEGSYFNSARNFDETSTIVALPPGNQFSEARLKLHGSYDLTDGFSIFGEANFKRTDSITLNFERTNLNVSDLYLGADMLLWSGIVNVIPEISVGIPPYPFPGTDNSVLVGDGPYTATGKIYVTKPINQHLIYAGAGYMWRSNGMSSQIPWDVVGHFAATRSIFVEGYLNGSYSLNDDQYSATANARKNVTDSLDGGSYMYYAVNPTTMYVGGRLGWRTEAGFFVSGGIEQLVAGNRAAQTTRFLLGIGLSDILGDHSHPTQRSRSRYVPSSSSGGKTQIFEEDTSAEDALENDMTVDRVKVQNGKRYSKPVR